MSEVRDMSDAELHRAVIEARKNADLALAKEAAVVSEWDRRKVWASNGSRSAAARHSRETGLSLEDSRQVITRAKKLRYMPLTTEAFESGKLSSSRVDLLARSWSGRTHAFFARDEASLLDAISGLSFARALKAVRYWSNLADAAGAESKAQKIMEQRSAYASPTFDGCLDVKALFEPIGGEIYRNELERLEKQLFKEDWAEAKKIHGKDTTAEHLARTPPQRRHDAMVLMAARSAAARAKHSKPSALVTIIAGEQSFANACELASGTVITPGQIVPWLSKCQIETIMFSGRSRIIDISHKRSFTGALRHAMQIRDGNCQHPSGCDVPAKDCDLDHIVAYSRGGLTIQENGQVMCPPHNRGKGAGPP